MPKKPDIPIALTAATFTRHPPSEALRAVQTASVDGLGEMLYISGEVLYDKHKDMFAVTPQNTYLKLVSGWKECLEVPEVAERGLICVMHHDTVIEDQEAFWELAEFVLEEDLAAAGPRDGKTVARGNQNGDLYLNTSFILANPRHIGVWWEGERFHQFDGVISFEDYWAMVHPCMGNLFYLETEWRDPPIGKTTTYLFRGRKIASHLWYSMGDIRHYAGRVAVEGIPTEDTIVWRREFIETYAKRFKLDDRDLLRRMDQTQRPEDWAQVIDSSLGREALQGVAGIIPYMRCQ